MMYRSKIVNVEAHEFEPGKPFPRHFTPDIIAMTGLKIGDYICKDQIGGYFFMTKEAFEKGYESMGRNISSFGMTSSC